MKKYYLNIAMLVSLALITLMVKNSYSQAIPDAGIEDAPMDNIDARKDTHTDLKNENQENLEKKSDKSKFEYRLYSIGNFSYQPITDTQHLAVVNGLFQEKSATAEMNLEMIHHSYMPHNAVIVLKTDLQGKVSSLYNTDSPFFEKGAGDWLKINEIFFDASSPIGLSVLVGKYRRIFSPGIFQNPMDRHNPKSALPGEPAQREGAWLSQLSFDGDFKSELLSRWRISVAYLPGFFQDKYGTPVFNRDKLILNPRSPLGVSRVTENYTNDYQGGFVRLYLDILKGDFNAIYYYTEKQRQEGISYSRYFLDRLELHAEILFYNYAHSDFIVTENTRELYVDALSGFRLDIGEYITLSVEYLYRQENLRNYPDSLADQKRLWLSQLAADSNGQTSTPMQHYIIVSLLAMNLKDILDVAFNVITNPYDQEYLFSLRTDYKVDKSSKLSLAGLYKVGDSSSFYGNYFPFDYQLRLEFNIAL